MQGDSHRPIVSRLRRLDATWARAEGALTVVVLILMVLTAGFQAAVRNLSRWDIQWAIDLLFEMEWADSTIRKGTLWLAFLGASLATHHGRHIGIDLLRRFARPRARSAMLAVSNLLAGVITLGLVVSFASALRLHLTELPLSMEVLVDNHSKHVCDAPATLLRELDFQKPTVFCAARSVLAVLGVPAENPGAAFQLIVPVMFFVVALRLMARGCLAATAVFAKSASDTREQSVCDGAVSGRRTER